jgi:hypothetical protein
MKQALSLCLVLLALVACVAQATQSGDFKREQLSPKGRVAYGRLRSACIFGVGRLGFGGEISKEELALYQLLDERQAVNALKSLVTAGSYEGGLYALLGLSFANKAEFDRAVEIYNARNEPPEWQATGSFECFRATGDTVNTMSGCIGLSESRTKVVARIQSGGYERLLTLARKDVRLERDFFRSWHKAWQLPAQ